MPNLDKGDIELLTDSLTGGQKEQSDARFDLLPVEALWQVAKLYGTGARKYAPHNWRKGYSWSSSYAALQRHANRFWAGEDIDEAGFPHMAAVAFHALALLTFMEEHRELDDRFTQPASVVCTVCSHRNEAHFCEKEPGGEHTDDWCFDCSGNDPTVTRFHEYSGNCEANP